MTRARTLADMISDGVIGTTELADDAITPVKLDETGSYAMAGLTVDTNTLHVDSANNRVGIGTTSPASQAHIYNASANANLRIETDADAYASISFLNDLSNWGVGVDNADHFYVYDSVNASNIMEFGNNDIVFNQTGKDYDFRVESDNRTHMLFVDAGADHVNIATGTDLGGTLNVNGSVVVSYSDPSIASLTIEDTGTSQAGLNLKAGSGATNRATRINFFNNVTSSSTPRWSILNDYYQNGDNGFWVADSVGNKFLTLTSNQAEPGAGSFIVNEDSDDINFRVESDTNNAAIHVDGSLSVVGINTSNASSYTTSNSLAIKGRDVAMIGNASSGSLATQFRFFNDQGTPYEIAGLKINVGAGQVNRGQWQFLTNNGAGNRQWLDVDYLGNVAFNEAGNDSDFRVESDNDTHALFVDASTNRVGISTSAPPVQFTVGGGDGTAELMLWGNNTNSTSSRLIFGAQDPYTSEYIQFRYNSDSNLLQLETDTGFGVGKIVQFDRQYGRVTLNEDSAADADFRVESNDNANMLFVDASLNSVVVGGNAYTDCDLVVLEDNQGARGNLRVGYNRQRAFTVSLHGSETRWFKLIGYTGGSMWNGRCLITINRNGGYNQSGAYREYKAAIGGFSNNIYGPLNATGDTGEGGSASLMIGTDEALYLQCNSNIYGGTVHVYLEGEFGNWQFDGTYVTTSP